MRTTLSTLFLLLVMGCSTAPKNPDALVFQSDFGLKDGAVAAMKGVAFEVSPRLKMFDITHEIPAYNIWEAAYRLHQTASYWPKGTVFVSVVDPGVGSERRSVVLRTSSGHYFVSPDNGTLTLVAEQLGIDEIREIDEAKNRRQNSGQSYTFHGRDVYAYTGARLAAGVIRFEDVGPELPKAVVRLSYQKPVFENGAVKGNIPVLDVQYGNAWSNIDQDTFYQLKVSFGDTLHVQVLYQNQLIFEGNVPYVKTFSEVKVGETMSYLNSLMCFSLGVSQDSFSEKYKVFSGSEWSVVINKKE